MGTTGLKYFREQVVLLKRNRGKSAKKLKGTWKNVPPPLGKGSVIIDDVLRSWEIPFEDIEQLKLSLKETLFYYIKWKQSDENHMCVCLVRHASRARQWLRR